MTLYTVALFLPPLAEALRNASTVAVMAGAGAAATQKTSFLCVALAQRSQHDMLQQTLEWRPRALLWPLF